MDMRVNNCIAQQEDYACVGLDTSLAVFVLESLHNSALVIEEGIGLAVFATKLIKDTAEGVGGPTQMLNLPHGQLGMEGIRRSLHRLD